MIDTNYRVEALEYLLDKECLTEKFYPLIPLKRELMTRAKRFGCKTKNDIAALSDSELTDLGLQDGETIRLLRRFLLMYDPDPRKFKEIETLDAAPEDRQAFRELYCLPGVKHTRALLYLYAGYRSLKSFADADPKEILERTAAAISAYGLPCVVPFPKEVRTHIAVAKAFTRDRLVYEE